MSSRSAFFAKNLTEGSLAAAARRAWAWYRSEFFALFSPATLAWLNDRGDRNLVIRLAEDSPEAWLSGGARKFSAHKIPLEELKAAPLDAVLERYGVSRESVKVALEVPHEKFFVRRFDVPAAARASLPRLLVAELERKTPFRPSDVFFGHVAHEAGRGEKLRVEQWILRRDIVEAMLEEAGFPLQELDVARPEPDERAGASRPVLVVNRRVEARNWFLHAVAGLACGGVLLLALGSAIALLRQDALSGELDAQIAAAAAQAATVRQMADQAIQESALLANLREERNTVPLLSELWEEISRILPDGAYVTELRLAEGKPKTRAVSLTGFADQAAKLPALFDESPLFAEAALTAAITPDAAEKLERFSLQATASRKKEQPQAPGAGRPPSP